jgi:hypothetical protein
VSKTSSLSGDRQTALGRRFASNDRGAGSDVVGIFVTKKLLIGRHFLAAKANWDLADLPIGGSFVGSFFGSFVGLFVGSFVGSFIGSFIGSFFVGSFDRGTSRLARYRVAVRVITTRATKLLSKFKMVRYRKTSRLTAYLVV